MNDSIRVVLVDPTAGSRDFLLPLIDRMESVLLAEACASYRAAAPRVAELRPDVSVVVVDADVGQATELIRAIVDEDPEAIVLGASHEESAPLLLRVVRAGARECLSLPTTPEELVRTLGRLTHRLEEPARPSGPSALMISVTGAAGEVGSTTMAVNLATTLAKHSSEEVLLVDMDLLFGSVDTQLDLAPENTLEDVVRSIDRLDQTLLKRMITRHSSGVYVLPRPQELQNAAQLDPEGLRATIAFLKSTFPVIVADTSKNVQSSDFVAFEMAEVILLVLQLERICLRNTARLLQCFQNLGGLNSRVQLVANRFGAYKPGIDIGTAGEMLQKPIAWKIPNSTKVFHAARDRGVPIDTISSRSEAQRALVDMAHALTGSLAPAPR